MMISVQGLTKAFASTKQSKKEHSGDPREKDGSFQALEEVSFGCQPGEVMALLGPNGAGKTTTLRILATAIQPDTGKILIDDKDVTHTPLLVRKQMGFLSGTTGVYGPLTARENIEYFAKLHGTPKREYQARLNHLADMLDMQHFLDKKADSLSTGMKQKTSLVRALIHNPSVVVLDEPTTGLDIMSTEAVLDFIRYCQNEGKAVIFSTHHLDEVEQLCQRVCVIAQGRSVFEGDIASFKQQGEGSLRDAFMGMIKQGDQHVARVA